MRRALPIQWLTSPKSLTGSPHRQKERQITKNKVFIGYDYNNDRAAKDRLLGWDTNKEFNFSSYDRSFDVAVDSPEAVAIKQDLAARIGDSSHFLCIRRQRDLPQWLNGLGNPQGGRAQVEARGRQDRFD